MFLYVIACAQCAEKYKCSVWRSSSLNKGVCLLPRTDSTGLWVDCCFDAEDRAFSGPDYPDPFENTYLNREDTLFLYSVYPWVEDLDGVEPTLLAAYYIRQKGLGYVMASQILPESKDSVTKIFTRVDTICRILSHYEYRFGWEVITDTQHIFTRHIPKITLLNNSFADSIRNFCRALDAEGLFQCPIEIELQGNYVILSAYPEQSDISVDYTGACSVMEHILFLRYEDFNAFVLPLSDSISVASCERTIIYTNGFKKVERDCSRTYSPPIRSKWFFVSARNAQGSGEGGGPWNFKANSKYKDHGSQISDGVYLSPRDAGNVFADAIKRQSGILAPLVQLGYGAYNITNTNKYKGAALSAATLYLIQVCPSLGLPAAYVMNGEDKLTQLCIDWGYNHYGRK